MKYDEQNVQQLIESIRDYQQKLEQYNHDDIHRFNTKLKRTIVYVILSVIYNRHLPNTVFVNESDAVAYVHDVLGEEVANVVGFSDKEWFVWLNRSIKEKQKFPYNVINKIKSYLGKK